MRNLVQTIADLLTVAAFMLLAQGTVFQGSEVDCIVTDSGCAAGTTDYYTNF